jgi:hypothetical protein
MIVMERVHFSHSSETRPATRSPSAETEQGFSAALQSSFGQSTIENELLQRERVALDGLVRDLIRFPRD